MVKLLITALLLPTYFGISVYQTETGREVVVPGMRVYATGFAWITQPVSTPGSFVTPSLTLAGYSVRLDGQVCPIELITPERLYFQVPLTVRPSTQPEGDRLLEISGPDGFLSQSLRVAIADPHLRQAPDESDPSCCASGMYSFGLGPSFFGVARINVGETGAFVAIGGFGMLAARDAFPAPEVIISRESFKQTFAAQFYPFAGFPGNDQAFFRAPGCLNGDYSVQVKAAGILSPPLTIRFLSDCAQPQSAPQPNCGTKDRSPKRPERGLLQPGITVPDRCSFWLND